MYPDPAPDLPSCGLDEEQQAAMEEENPPPSYELVRQNNVNIFRLSVCSVPDQHIEC